MYLISIGLNIKGDKPYIGKPYNWLKPFNGIREDILYYKQIDD